MRWSIAARSLRAVLQRLAHDLPELFEFVLDSTAAEAGAVGSNAERPTVFSLVRGSLARRRSLAKGVSIAPASPYQANDGASGHIMDIISNRQGGESALSNLRRIRGLLKVIEPA